MKEDRDTLSDHNSKLLSKSIIGAERQALADNDPSE